VDKLLGLGIANSSKSEKLQEQARKKTEIQAEHKAKIAEKEGKKAEEEIEITQKKLA
jgi:hypothetical protein